MPIIFPSSPSANQLFQYNGNSYQWDGSKWRKTNIFSNSIVTEYTNKVEQTTSTVDIQPDKYNYHVLDITGDTTISVPSSAPNSSFILELNYTAGTVTWSSNIQWAGGTAPTIDYAYSSNIIIHLYTTDGVNWIGSPLSLDSRSS